MNNIWIVAQTGNGDAPQTITSESINSEAETATGTIENGTNGGTEQQETEQRQPGFSTWIFLPLIVFMVFMLFRAPQKQKKERKKLEQEQERKRILRQEERKKLELVQEQERIMRQEERKKLEQQHEQERKQRQQEQKEQ